MKLYAQSRQDKRSIYKTAKVISRPYNTIKDEIARGTVYLCNGNTVIEKVNVFSKENIVFEFKGSTEVTWSIE